MARRNAILRNELVTSDQKACGDFFAGLLGWDRMEIDMGPLGIYTLFQVDGKDVAGMMNPLTDYSGTRPFWSAYIEVDDVDACAAKVEELGGAVVVAPEDILNVGRVCIIEDPAGAPICLMKRMTQLPSGRWGDRHAAPCRAAYVGLDSRARLSQ